MSIMDRWLDLPEIVFPTIASEADMGSIYMVHRVGIYWTGRQALPAIDIEFDGRREVYRLPRQLSDWACVMVDCAEFFPCEIEFGIWRGRHYAEVI